MFESSAASSIDRSIDHRSRVGGRRKQKKATRLCASRSIRRVRSQKIQRPTRPNPNPKPHLPPPKQDASNADATAADAARGQRDQRKDGGDHGRSSKKPDLSQAPPFTLADLRAAIPPHCFRKSAARSLAHAAKDLAIISTLACAAYAVDSWCVWPLYWLLQGTMMWALFCVGHDAGHGSFSDSRALNDAIGHLAHSLILVPYHGWRLSHKKHHGNHGHVDNDESWHPVTKSQYDSLGWQARLGRLTWPVSLLSFPFYLIWGSPGRAHSHYHPHSDLFNKHQRPLVIASDAWLAAAYAALGAAVWGLGAAMVAKVYLAPWLVFVAWLDAVTYLHHHVSVIGIESIHWRRESVG